jgi:hypothetical protein
MNEVSCLYVTLKKYLVNNKKTGHNNVIGIF